MPKQTKKPANEAKAETETKVADEAAVKTETETTSETATEATGETEVSADEAGADEAEASDAAIAASKKISLGSVQCGASVLKLDEVLGRLDQLNLDRLDAMRSAPSITALAKQMLLSEGRGAPIVFIQSPFKLPYIFFGHDTIAAAIEAGIKELVVLTAKPDDAQALQSYLVEKTNKKPVGDSDEELIFRVNEFYGD